MENSDLQEKLLKVLTEREAAQNASASPWRTAPAVEEIAPSGVLVPLRIETPLGQLRVYLSLPPACAESESRLLDTLEQLGRIYPLDFWKRKDSWQSKRGSRQW